MMARQKSPSARPAPHAAHYSTRFARCAACLELSFGQQSIARKLHRALSETFPLQPLAFQLPGTPDGFRRFARTPFGRLLVVSPEFHLPEYAFALHLLLQRFKRLVNVIISNEDLHEARLLNLLSYALAKKSSISRTTEVSHPIVSDTYHVCEATQAFFAATAIG
jgi:hypothetical protein